MKATCLLATVVLFIGVSVRAAEPTADRSQALFEKVFGDAVKLDPQMIARVKAAKPNERIYVDRDGDGKNDECWFIDTLPKGMNADPALIAASKLPVVQPMLVRVIDEDGDMDAYKGPDLDSDLYVVDYQADGKVDVVLDYTDLDGDNDVDEMAFYFYMKHHPYFGDDVLRVWWGRDDGDDNLLWYDLNYNYTQPLCQYRCHFSGDESFVAFGLLQDSQEWLSAFENPFLFYDPDRDTCSEVVLRIEGQGNQVQAIRYSFDADDDAYGRRTHDYDFSITARAEPDKPVVLPDSVLVKTQLRGIPTQGWLNRHQAQEFVINQQWPQALLTWDELNANTEAGVQYDPFERWEGVIARGSKDFKQVGGPPCSQFNKRNEIWSKATSGVVPDRLMLYYDPSDRRLHLAGAEEGWLDVDYNFDGKLDAKYTWVDEDGDGRFDWRRIDVDGDGTIDFEFRMNPLAARPVILEWRRIAPFYKMSLPKILDESQAFLDAVNTVCPPAEPDPVELFYEKELAGWMPQTRLGEHIRKSPAGQRFYMELLRDRALARLKKELGERDGWGDVVRLYGAGEYAGAAEAVMRFFGAGRSPVNVNAFGAFTKRVALQIDNTGMSPRPDWPVVVPVARIRRVAPDFNPANCAVVDGRRAIAWRPIPHQVDEIDPQTGPELSFIADLPAYSAGLYYLYYSPEGTSVPAFAHKTGTAEDWVPPNIGWESNRGAYRAYWGQFDFFGKKTEQLIYGNIGAKSYHEEVEWGIDALHVGKASGLGGLTLYRGDEAYLVQNPAGEGKVQFSKRQLVSGPVRAAVEIVATNVVPEQPDLAVRMLCIIYAERQETEVRASVSNAAGEVVLAPGIVKLPRESVFENAEAGTLGSWGWQEEVIGDIGMAVIAPPASVIKIVDLPHERRMQCKLENGRLRYWLIGDWRRGRQHPVAPTIDNWQREVSELAKFLNKDAGVTLGAVESVAKTANDE
ncbi:MAG TPA: DUF4861 family protein [Phycisphaerae bacterium]|nr:DUF4861 family protein [Phycisphaerae bacterium]HOJ73219.1 DUF4861 family protein [Phycisphaerae bacterium]HOM51215.1 DUF4861 family protein [Phycisphaerae bacterium]HPP25343.1 DUF4861 family protein [Phycisphaerae bacterium]HPU24646.1 DUF4861 family protein [Phycisphaerae bacterium]